MNGEKLRESFITLMQFFHNIGPNFGDGLNFITCEQTLNSKTDRSSVDEITQRNDKCE